MKTLTPLSESVKNHNTMPYAQNERGAALIVVMFMLILIGLGGAIAVKQSSTDLKIATADQINTLLLQSSDGANSTLENVVNGPITDQAYKDLLGGGLLWFFLRDNRATGSEYSYCFNTNKDKFLLKNAIVKQNPEQGSGTLYSNALGICDYRQKTGYVNERQTAMVQVNVTTTAIKASDEALSHMPEGREVGSSGSDKVVLDVYSTGLVPSYSEPKGCMDKSAITKDKVGGELLECLKQANTPTKMLFQKIEVENVANAETCKPFGKGDGALKCTIS